MDPEMFTMDTSNVISNGGGSDFLSRQKSLFDTLDAAEQARSCNRIETPESISHRHHVFDSSTHNKHKKRAETKRFRGQESIFVKPDPPSPWKGKHIPDHRKNPHKWTKYSLGDVSPDDMSDKTNMSTALSFLNELQKRKELSKRSSEKMEEDSNTSQRSPRTKIDNQRRQRQPAGEKKKTEEKIILFSKNMASALEQFVNNVRALSSQGNYRDVHDLILKSNDVLVKNGIHLDTVLETLNYQLHSLGVLAVLVAKFSLLPPLSNHDLLYIQMQDFINGCNGEQVRFAPEIYAELCHYFTRWLVEHKTPARGIEILKKAIRKIQLFDSQLTSVHADLCQLCLLSKNLKPALEFLDTDITSINQEGSQFDAEYFLRYYYYGGMIYTALKNLERAIYFYEVAVTTPALAVSHIMLEAYKKYILVSLIMHGKVGALPKYTSQVVSRFIRPASQPYHELASAYATTRTADVQNVLQKYAEIFSRENNTGLTKQVLTSLTKKNIQRLTKTFLTLSLSDVASRVQLPGPSDAERLILNMIEDNEIFATINQKDGMVIFHEDPEKYNSPNMLQRLRSEMLICMELDRKIQGMEEEIIVNPQFVKKSSGTQEEDSAPAASAQTSKATTYSM